MATVLSKSFEAADNLLGRERRETPHVLYLCLHSVYRFSVLSSSAHSDTLMLAGIQSYVFGFIGAMNVALLLWVRRIPK